jgi:protein ImuB
MVACVLISRFELLAAVGAAPSELPDFASKRNPVLFEALALAPEPDRAQVVGEVSGAAQALGIHPGMRLGEALARCPGLRLIPPDPERSARAWETVIGALEGIGAAVEPAAP